MPVSGVAAALLKGSTIPLHVNCHDVYWHASPMEIQQLREYLSVAGVNIQRVAKRQSTHAPNITLVIDAPITSSSQRRKNPQAAD
jgi:hypothetical protein